MTAHTWIRFAGRLWEDLSFVPETGWETRVVAHRPPSGDGTWTLELLDAEGRVVTDTSPRVRFAPAPGQTPGRMQSARLVAYLPLHPDARTVRLRRHAWVVAERKVAGTAPAVRITELSVAHGRTATLCWEADHDDPDAGPLSYRVVYVAGDRGVFPIVRDLHRTRLEIPLARLPGARAGRFAVMATDGLRSGVALSPELAVPASPAHVAILAPERDARLPWGQPITIRGTAHDDAGRLLDADGMVWTLDGEPLQRETRLMMLRTLPAGEHTLVLAWEGAGAPRAETRTRFHVAPDPRRARAPRTEDEAPPPLPQGATLRIKL